MSCVYIVDGGYLQTFASLSESDPLRWTMTVWRRVANHPVIKNELVIKCKHKAMADVPLFFHKELAVLFFYSSMPELSTVSRNFGAFFKM